MRRGRDGRLRGQADDDPGARRRSCGGGSPGSNGRRPRHRHRRRASRGRRSIEAAVLDELTGGDPAFAASLLADFVETSRSDLRALGEAIAARDHVAARTQAHRVKGAGRIVGATELVAVATRMESTATAGNGDWDALAAQLESLDGLLARIAAEVPS